MRNIAIVICCIALVLVGYKFVRVAGKIHYYNEGAAHLENNDLLAAEESFMRTSENRWIRYKEAEIQENLVKLQPVTTMKQLFTTLDEDAGRHADKGDLDSLLQVSAQYEQAKADYAKQEPDIAALFKTMDERFGIDEALNSAFANIKRDIINEVDASIKNSSFEQDSYIAQFAKLPAGTFGDEKAKGKEVAALFKKYDTAKLNYWAKKKSVPDYLIATAALSESYQKSKMKASWIVPLVEQHIQDQLTPLIEKDELSSLTTFIEYAKLAEANQQWIGSKSKLYTYITKEMNAQLKEADQLVKTKEFAGAIELYTVLGTYKDTKDKIEAAETAWLKNEPSRLLTKALPEQTFTLAVGQKGTHGSSFEAAGLNGSTLTYVRMMPDKKYEISHAKLDENLKVEEIQFAHKYSGQALPTLLVKGDSAERNNLFLLLELNNSYFKQILAVDADEMELERKGVILVNNATGEGEGQESYYEYTNDFYEFAGIKNDYVDILLDDLGMYLGEEVRFQVEVTSVGDNQAFVSIQDGYIILNGNFNFELGPQVIVGTWTGIEEIVVDSQLYNAYIVEVSDVQPVN
jgi:hypothetical protein